MALSPTGQMLIALLSPVAPFVPFMSANAKRPKSKYFGRFFEEMAATYSRGIYKTTTIGNTALDGRVRNGNGSDHSIMATKNRKSVLRS